MRLLDDARKDCLNHDETFRDHSNRIVRLETLMYGPQGLVQNVADLKEFREEVRSIITKYTAIASFILTITQVLVSLILPLLKHVEK